MIRHDLRWCQVAGTRDKAPPIEKAEAMKHKRETIMNNRMRTVRLAGAAVLACRPRLCRLT